MKKHVLIIVSCLMVLTLALASCGTTTTEEGKVTEEGEAKVVITKTGMEEKEEGPGHTGKMRTFLQHWEDGKTMNLYFGLELTGMITSGKIMILGMPLRFTKLMVPGMKV